MVDASEFYAMLAAGGVPVGEVRPPGDGPVMISALPGAAPGTLRIAIEVGPLDDAGAEQLARAFGEFVAKVAELTRPPSTSDHLG